MIGATMDVVGDPDRVPVRPHHLRHPQVAGTQLLTVPDR